MRLCIFLSISCYTYLEYGWMPKALPDAIFVSRKETCLFVCHLYFQYRLHIFVCQALFYLQRREDVVTRCPTLLFSFFPHVLEFSGAFSCRCELSLGLIFTETRNANFWVTPQGNAITAVLQMKAETRMKKLPPSGERRFWWRTPDLFTAPGQCFCVSFVSKTIVTF